MNSISKRFAQLLATVAFLLSTSLCRPDTKVPKMNIDPLMTAIAANNAEDVKRLVTAAPALLTANCDGAGRTPLHVAAALNRQKVAEALMTAGADFYARDENGQLALDVPPGGTLNETSKYLRGINDARNRFIGAASEGQLTQVTALLKADSSLAKAVDIGSGSSALLLACFKGHTDVARLLIDAGADIHLLEWSTGTDALYWSIESGHTECARLLLDSGANVERKWDLKYGSLPMKMNALHYASWKGKTAFVDLLLKHKADPNARAVSYALFTPLHFAASEGHAEIVSLLLHAGGNPKALDGRRGIDAVEMAARGKHAAVTQALAVFAGVR